MVKKTPCNKNETHTSQEVYMILEDNGAMPTNFK